MNAEIRSLRRFFIASMSIGTAALLLIVNLPKEWLQPQPWPGHLKPYEQEAAAPKATAAESRATANAATELKGESVQTENDVKNAWARRVAELTHRYLEETGNSHQPWQAEPAHSRR
jgi:hypothetical protein